MDLPPPPMFADVQSLLATSQPRARLPWMTYALVAIAVSVLATTLFGGRTAGQQQAAEAASTFVMVLVLGSVFLANSMQARALRTEHARLEAAEELVQLRRWPQAAMLLQSILSRPARSPQARLQALVCFASVLSRFHRFDDVSTITEHLLETTPLESAGVHALRLARATALLRQDRLFDADRAISELRRMPDAAESGGLALLELYRDVKTGHAAEGLEIFAAKKELIRRQFGHRIADAYLLAASAYDRLQNTQAASDAYRTATLLAPAVELHRRYPETAGLAGKYAAEPAPAEVIG
ncbi:MAG TPA: hypothetical protein VL992_10740 [Tepidisphaeraceae bacterium]|nr:hypothetical protein [Tepidisphaeraceae bacterium]